jgi:hypothetical protein
MKRILAGVALVALATSTWAAPVVVAGKQYNVTGKIGVKAVGKCYGHSVAGGGYSPTPIDASILLGNSDQAGGTFTWFNDTIMVAPVATGTITERNGNKLTLKFDGDATDGAGSVLFTMSGIQPGVYGDGAVEFGGYKFDAVVSNAKVNGQASTKIKITESVSTSMRTISTPCSFKWTVKRVLTGVETTPTPPPM